MNLRKFTRKSIYYSLESDQAKRRDDRIIGTFLSTLILLNILAVILETVESIKAQYGVMIEVFEVFSVAVFTVEYVIRLWASVEKEAGQPIISRLKFALSPMAIIDLLAIMPFYLPLFVQIDLRYLRALRLMRIVRILKLGRYSKSLKLLTHVLKDKMPDLIVTASVGFVLLTVSASAMYFFENKAQPEVFSSIPAAMWWAVSTLTTVGYGDVFPITMGGKIFGSFVAVLGVGLIAIPAGILGAGLIEAIEGVKGNDIGYCTHCKRGSQIKDKLAS